MKVNYSEGKMEDWKVHILHAEKTTVNTEIQGQLNSCKGS